MTRATKRLGLAMALIGLMGGVARADLTYDLIDHPPSSPGGWTLSGAITTDGTSGALTSSDVTVWQFSATDGTTTYFASSFAPGAQLTLSGLTATPTELVLGDGGLLRLGAPFGGGDHAVAWTLDGANSVHEVTSSKAGVEVFSEQLPAGPGVAIAARVSAVPEPSALVLAGLAGLLGLGGYGWRRRLAGPAA